MRKSLKARLSLSRIWPNELGANAFLRLFATGESTHVDSTRT